MSYVTDVIFTCGPGDWEEFYKKPVNAYMAQYRGAWLELVPDHDGNRKAHQQDIVTGAVNGLYLDELRKVIAAVTGPDPAWPWQLFVSEEHEETFKEATTPENETPDALQESLDRMRQQAHRDEPRPLPPGSKLWKDQP